MKLERVSALDRLREEYITEEQLAGFLGVDTKRVRDLRSYHVNGKCEFIAHIKPTSKCILYRYKDVLAYFKTLEGTCSFGIAKDDPE